MKLLMITQNTKPTSGWGRQTLMTVREYEARGIEYHIISEAGGAAASANESPILLPSDSFVSIARNLWRVRRASRGGYDVIHTLDVWPYGLYGYAAAIGTNAKLFLNGIGTYSVAPLYVPFKRLVLRAVFARTTKIFCISDYTMREMARAMPSLSGKLVLVPLGANPLPAPNDADIAALRERFSITGSPILLTVGAIKDRKGQLDTLKAVELLKVAYPDIVYLIVGSSGDTKYVESIRTYARTQGLEANMCIIDSIRSDTDLTAMYQLCDVFALNSNTDQVHHHFEGFGMVIIEAAQFGKPAVGSRGCGIESAIDDGVSGLLTVQHDPKDIADKIQVILKSYESFSRNAKARYSMFSWNQTVAHYVEWFE